MSQALIGGLLTGCVYAVVAYGYHLTWITTRTVNFGQGTLLMVGGMTAYVCVGAGIPYGVAIVAAAVVGAVVGVVTERVAIAPVVGRVTHTWVLSTFGLAIILQSLAAIIWGVNPLAVNGSLDDKTITIAGAHVTAQDLLTALWSIVAMAVVIILLQRTTLGKAVRAVASNRRAASLVGISPTRIAMLSYALASLTSAVVGALLAGSDGVKFDTGLLVGFQAFFAAMLGGIDSTFGVILGGLAVGVLGSLVGYWNPLFEQSVVLIAIAAALAVRPFGVAGRRPVERV